eukprot:scaffold14342_cov54-Cylindrotheca_fusiformis.AAC.1
MRVRRRVTYRHNRKKFVAISLSASDLPPKWISESDKELWHMLFLRSTLYEKAKLAQTIL